MAQKIREHGAETYPHECCGALFGRDLDAGTTPAPEQPCLLRAKSWRYSRW